MKKYKIILPVVAIATAVLTIVIFIFAWYISTDRMRDMKFDILQIDSLVTLYEAEDANFNGVPNKVASGNENKYYSPEADAIIDYNNLYHNENYEFNYIDQRYALSQDSSANLLNTIIIKNAAPSKVYGYKLEITNYVGYENTLDFEFIADSNINLSILSDFQARLGCVDKDSNVTFTEWTDFVTDNTYSGIELNPFENNMIVPAKSKSIAGQDMSVGRLDVWLQIRINPLATNDNIEEFLLPKYKLTLSCELPDA